MKNLYPLQRARAWRSYLGGAMIGAFFGEDGVRDGHYPEEWIASVVPARNAGRPVTDPPEGLSMLKDDPRVSLRDLLAAEPVRLLGDVHVRRWGASPGVLLKIIDAAERLTIQVHPDRATAAALFNSPFGKTECWHILGGRDIDGERPCIYFGFKPGVTRAQWEGVFAAQDIPAMLDCLHRLDVRAGETYLIPGGIPHAIGAGCFLLEVQEPTDFTIRTERTTPSGMTVPDESCHQGLGFTRMFDCFHYDGVPCSELLRRLRVERQGDTLISHAQSGCFAMAIRDCELPRTLPATGAFRGLFVLSGQGVIATGTERQVARKGDQFFVAAAAGDIELLPDPAMTLIEFAGPQCVASQEN